MSSVKDQLTNMLSKVMAGTVTREEGSMLLNHLVKEDEAGTLRELTYLVDNPPPDVPQKTILHTIAFARNKAFFKIMASSLENENDEVSVQAAHELARFKTDEAKDVLIEHLSVEAYQIRKASASAFAQGFGAEGIEILKEHIMTHPDPLYRATSAQALLGAGRPGLEALLPILSSVDPGPVQTVVEVIGSAGGELSDEDMRRIVDALLLAGDREDALAITALLEAVASFGPRAMSLEAYVMAFADHPSEGVRNAAQGTLEKIRPKGPE